MSMSSEDRVNVEVEGFDPEMDETNKSKDLVIAMHYHQESDDDVDRVEKMMKFTLNWGGLNLERLFNDHDTTVFGWLDMLEVEDDFARFTVVDRTLLALEQLLEEMHKESLSRPSYLGLKITITVFADNNAMETEPEYYGSEDESNVEDLSHNTVVETDQSVFYLEDQNASAEGEDSMEDDEYVGEVTYSQEMYIEEEYEEYGIDTHEEAKTLLIYRGVEFCKFDEVGHLAHENSCSICLEEFGGKHDENKSEYEEEKDEVAVLPCQHVLHAHCLVDWFVQGADLPTCPLCRHHLRVLFI